MFVEAIKEVANFTRAIHSISRNFGNPKIQRGSASLFFINEEGWALTCKHVAQWLGQAEQVNKRFSKFMQESKGLTGTQQNKFAKKLGLSPDQLFEMRITFVDCVDQIKNLKFILHPEYDLALLKFEGFQKPLYSQAPRFLADDQSIQSGEMLCRLGFPFPEFNNFVLEPTSQTLQWTKEGAARSPRFPIEGMVTRFLGNKKGEIYGIEMSTPGLRGQSGGPLFDTKGRIYGMQSRTKHLHLGFDIEEKEVIAHGKTKKINDYAFIHLGECIHVKVIKDFMRQHQVRFSED
ncbi:S1 family peptidase [Algoriphagus hitonicola]|uniref:Trypsin-like peptidase domain-containing protein n=1 Tax=Algoriphagus hitonicola TaxID=435880 RepID=A0A1I2V1I1_9BACT|nr:serine protease [Algoriphagus hitonicola]SFG82329.1 Trypsin-like peptidase domain-containing protein [Algoriphagus hitonicola]